MVDKRYYHSATSQAGVRGEKKQYDMFRSMLKKCMSDLIHLKVDLESLNYPEDSDAVQKVMLGVALVLKLMEAFEPGISKAVKNSRYNDYGLAFSGMLSKACLVDVQELRAKKREKAEQDAKTRKALKEERKNES